MEGVYTSAHNTPLPRMCTRESAHHQTLLVLFYFPLPLVPTVRVSVVTPTHTHTVVELIHLAVALGSNRPKTHSSLPRIQHIRRSGGRPPPAICTTDVAQLPYSPDHTSHIAKSIGMQSVTWFSISYVCVQSMRISCSNPATTMIAMHHNKGLMCKTTVCT